MRLRYLALIALMASAASLEAQAPATEASRSKGFFLGLGLSGTTLDFEDADETENGSGGFLTLGYGFTPKFALFLEGAAATIASDDGDYILSHFDVGARYHFANPARRWVPFIDAAITGRAAGQEDVEICDGLGNCTTDDLTFSGAGFSLGGGVAFHATPALAITGALRWTSGEFSDVKFGDVTVSGLEADAVTTRVNLGITWWPSRPR